MKTDTQRRHEVKTDAQRLAEHRNALSMLLTPKWLAKGLAPSKTGVNVFAGLNYHHPTKKIGTREERRTKRLLAKKARRLNREH